jgi:putative SOS response-associated peptidase YedK
MRTSVFEDNPIIILSLRLNPQSGLEKEAGMCGRFTLTVSAEDLQAELGLQSVPPEYQPRFNVAPTQPVAVLDEFPAQSLELMRWGLVPSWADDPAIGNRLINARAETVAEKPAFRKAFVNRRCLILADGFYEWQAAAGKKGPKQPYYFRSPAERVIAFAGLYEVWYPKDGEPLKSCTIITTAANERVSPVHDRMPVILPREAWADWLKPKQTIDQLVDYLRPYPTERMEAFPVSLQVNNPAVDAPTCLEPWGGPQ